MERQLANLTGLVQKALVQNPQAPTGAQPFMQGGGGGGGQGPYRNGKYIFYVYFLHYLHFLICKKNL